MHWHPEVVQYAQSKKDPYFSFSALVQYHPDNCWKIACCALSTGIFKTNDSFVKEAAPVFLMGFRKEKKEKELRLREIIGSFYEDPSSLIDQAWKIYNAYDHTSKLGEMYTKKNEQVSIFLAKQFEISPSVHLQDRVEVKTILLCNSNLEKIIYSLNQKGVSVKEECIPQCRLLCDLDKECSAIFAKASALKKEYDLLEKERIDCENEIEDLNDRIDWTLTPWEDDLPHTLFGHRIALKKRIQPCVSKA